MNRRVSGELDTAYTINITYAGETWTSTVSQAIGRKLISLSYNTNYSLNVIATNCAGRSEVYTISPVFIGMFIYQNLYTICH